MPRPGTDGLSLLVRKQLPSYDEWIGLINSRREMIKPYLNIYTLPELGKLECMRDEFHHSLETDIIDEVLKTQGIFHVQPWGKIVYVSNSGWRPGPGCVPYPNGTKKIWGLTRQSKWIIAAVEFIGVSRWKESGQERATSVTLSEVSLPALIAETEEEPRNIWRAIGEAIKNWVGPSQQRYAEATNLAKMVEIEEMVFGEIPGALST